MYVGTQYFGTSKLEMEYLTRHGVTHFDATVENMETDTLKRHKEEAAKYGVDLDMVHLPWHDNIGLANSERDRDIDKVCTWIENAAQAGLRGLNYNFLVLRADGAGGGVQRTARKSGRGGSTYSTFVLSEYDNDKRYAAGDVSRDECFERAAYYVERIMPVAEANKIQMACHLNDILLKEKRYSTCTSETFVVGSTTFLKPGRMKVM